MDYCHSDWIEKWSLYSPEAVCAQELETGRAITYEQLHRQSSTLASIFQNKYNIKKGGRIAILSENSLEHILLFAVAIKTGAILVPLNFRLSHSELDYITENADPNLFVISEKFNAFKSTLQEKRPEIEVVNIEELFELSESEVTQTYEIEKCADDDAVFILYTSGTTGFPKGAIYSYGMMFWNGVNTALALHINAQSVTINCMPFFHTGGWNVLTTPLLHRGGTVYLMNKFDASKALSSMEALGVTIFMGVPTMLAMMAKEDKFASVNLDQLQYIIVGGEPMPISLIEQWHERGVPIRQGYGMTEVGPNLTSLHHDDAQRKRGSIGRPNFYVKTRIVDEELNDVPVGMSGELLLAGPMVTPGYWRNEASTSKAIVDGWFRTGDVVRKDEDDYFFILDRIKNMYISGGENVYPAEVERVISAMPGIEEVAVHAIPDPKWGESGRAVIVLKGNSEVGEKEVLAHCRSHLAKFKIPKAVLIVKSIPKTETGKIDRKSIVKLL